MMTNNTTRKGVVRAHRKPMVAARSRKTTVSAESESLAMKKQEITIKRPVTSEAQMTQMQTTQTQMAQTQTMTQMTQALDQQVAQEAQRNEQLRRVNMRMSQRRAHMSQMNARQHQTRPTSQELKQQAISQVLAKTAKATPAKRKQKKVKVHFGFKRILLATICAAIAVFAIVYFVNLNAPNISLKVAAMQSGIEASYPSYVPRDFSLSDITSENGKITLNFKNTSTGDAFTLVEEKSSWDSNALFNNYIKATYGDNYTLIREQGLALYISGSDASWVNGGVLYKLKTISGSLTKKQIKTIAVSL